MVSVAGARIAAPSPCTARAIISHVWFWARPPSRLADREHGETDQEDLAATEEISRTAAEEEKSGECQRVRVDDPLQARAW